MADETKKQEDLPAVKAGKKEVSKNVAKLVEEISKLSVLELSGLVSELQDVLGVSAMPVATAAPAAPGGEAAADEGGAAGANQTVVITAAGDNKIAVIKAIRAIDQNLGLKEAKDMTENLPAEVLKDAKAEDAQKAAEGLKAAGATIELK